MNELTHGSLFSGIGGFEEGAKRSGIETKWNCEILPYNRKVLQKIFPNTFQYEDIYNCIQPPRTSIISGGFPCQDISISQTNPSGINGTRSGLWTEMFRVCREVMPRYIIIENSPALLNRGFEKILLDLSKIGYNAEWQCISNLSFGYPHVRERLYVIAYPNAERFQGGVQIPSQTSSVFKKWTPNQINGINAAKRFFKISDSNAIRADDGVKHWSHRIAGIGNAVNASVATYLFECIKIHNKSNNH